MVRAWPSQNTAPRVNDEVVVDLARCLRPKDRHPMAAKALRITLPDMVTSRRYLPQLEIGLMSKADAFSITLPVTESSAST